MKTKTIELEPGKAIPRTLPRESRGCAILVAQAIGAACIGGPVFFGILYALFLAH